MIDALAPAGPSVLESLFSRPSPMEELRDGNGPDPLRKALEGPDRGDRADLSPLSGALARKGGAVALLEFNYQSVRVLSEQRSGNSFTRTEFLYESFEMNLTVAGDPEAATALFDRLKEEFTPEKVSERIAQFGIEGFLRGSGFAAEGAPAPDRAALRDGILAAARQGLQDALALLGPLDPDVRSQLDRTLELLEGRLDAFARGEEGDPAEADRNLLSLDA